MNFLKNFLENKMIKYVERVEVIADEIDEESNSVIRMANNGLTKDIAKEHRKLTNRLSVLDMLHNVLFGKD